MMCLSNGINLETATATDYLSTFDNVVEEGDVKIDGGESGGTAKRFQKF